MSVMSLLNLPIPHLCLELRIGFTQYEYSGVEGDFVRPVVAISSGTLAPGLSVAVRFISAFLRARGESASLCMNSYKV